MKTLKYIHRRTPGLLLALACGSAMLASCQTSGAQQDSATGATQPASARVKTAAFSRAIWMWDAGAISDAAKQKALFDFCSSKNIVTIYQNVGNVFFDAPSASGDKNPVTPTALAAYLRNAHVRGFKVEALDGDPGFALQPKHALTLARLQKALDYNKTAAATERIDGYQWDTEPYILPEFKTPEGERAILTQYLDSAVQMRDAVQKSGQTTFALGYAIPFWMDGAEHEVDWNGVKKPATHHLMDVLNGIDSGYVAIMAYRDVAEGGNGSIGITQGEADYATNSAPKVKVWVGQETLDVKGDPPSITFWQEGEGELNKAIEQIAAHYKNTPAVAGVAIHHFESYREISQRPAAKPVTRDFKIVTPEPGPVERVIEVTGTASTGQKVVVAIKPDGDIWYEQPAVPVIADGIWSATVRAGNEGTKAGAGFTIRATLQNTEGKNVDQLEIKVTRK